MCTTRSQLFCLLITSVVVLSACNLPVTGTAEVSQTEPPATAVSTVAELTNTETAATETATMTPTETSTPEPSATVTQQVPIATVRRESNCRNGPAGNYDLIATYQVGQKLEVVAKDLGNIYWFVKNPEKPEEQCYILVQNIAIEGETAALPKFTPLPSPTEAPFFEAKFKKFDTCTAQDYAVFTVENTGSVPFRSSYIKVTDQRVKKSVEEAYDWFHQYVGCTLAREISPLDPDETGFVDSPRFPWNPNGHKLTAIIMLCTQQGLKGVCITQTVEVKP